MRPFKALLVGLGRIGCGYDAHLDFEWNQPYSSSCILTHARALACHSGFELVGGIDLCPVARKRFVKLYGKPAHEDLNVWRLASSGFDPDLVIVAVAPELQPALVEQLLSISSPRLLLLEKPIASNLSEALVLKNVCAKKPGLVVAVNYIRRYLSSVQLWQNRLASHELGRLLHGRITYGKGLLSNGSHFVNLAEAWLGPLNMHRLMDSGSSCFGFDREASLELQVQAHGSAPLHVLSVGDSGLRAGELDLWFNGGRLCWQNDGKSINFWSRHKPVSEDSYAFLAESPDSLPTEIDHYQHEVLNNLQKLLTGVVREPACTLESALETFRTLNSALSL